MAGTTKTRKASAVTRGAAAIKVAARKVGSTAKKATPAKKAAAKKATPAKKTAAKRATPPKKATPAKKTAAKKASPAKKTAAKKTAAKKTAAKKTVAKKASPAKKATPAKKTAAKKATPAKKTVAKKATPAKKTAAKKTAAPAKKTAVKKTAAKKSPPAKKTAAKKSRTTGAKRTVTNPTTTVDTLAVKPDEDAWTTAEIDEVRAELTADRTRLLDEIGIAERGLADLLSGGVDGAGNDQADVGSNSLERDAEMSLVANHRDLLLQVEKALSRIDAGTYGNCENCGEPIGKMRLMAFPRATLCMTCKQREERR
ncbi:TraR/DksA family transcriptional regulator [Mumia sp. Pv 4-285]|uniref:TraR/DksA family transcriptional regulator n=1 Tax=Mumia qirimensis TaxID=3234852 RepID=UPI00351D4E9F